MELVKKKLKKIKKKELEDQYKNPPIFRFLDPYQNYILYGDVVFTNTFWHNKAQFVYPFELYLDYKAIRQIHVRPQGIIFEVEDFSDNVLSSVPFLQDRLKSLGEKNASDLADLLECYNDYFLNDSIPEQQKLLMQEELQTNSNESIFEWVDSKFEANKENVLFLKGNRMISKKDYKAQFLCYNSKLIEWLTKEQNIFSQEFIRDCFKVSYFADFEGFTNLVKHFCLGIKSQGENDKTEGELLTKSINTIAGKVDINVTYHSIFFPQKKMYFHYWIHAKENYDKKTNERFQEIATFDQNLTKKIKPKMAPELGIYSNLMKYYYCLKKK